MNSAVRSKMLGVVVALSLVASGFAADQTTDDPAAMAAQYTQQALDLRAGAKRHAETAKMHRSGLAGSSKTSHASIVQHCEKIASNLNAAAIETEALAATYRKMAAEKPATK